MRRYRVKRTVICFRVGAPESGSPRVRDPWTKTISQQTEKPENNIAVCPRIGHYLVWHLIRLLLQNDSQNDQAIPERSRNNNVVYPRILVRYQVVPCNPTPLFKVFRVGAGMYRAHRNNKSHTIGWRHLTTTLDVRQGNATLCCDQNGVGCPNRFIPV